MQELTMVRMENFPGFLVSFDRQKWWRTEALQGNVESVLDVMWIYGEYHVCIAKMVDGTYAIYQSYHHIDDTPGDLHWRCTLTSAERMYCLVRPDYGRVLLSTSAGWWRSENAGTNWTKVSTQAPGCFAIKEITNNILIALDGQTVWRSTDSGSTWSKAKAYGTTDDLIAKTTYPAVDGTYTDLLVGCTFTNAPALFGDDRHTDHKGILLYSQDAGITFTILSDLSYWWIRPSCGTGYSVKDEYITDIELASVGSDGLSYLAVQVKMPNGMSRVYQATRVINPGRKQYSFLARFDAPTSASNSITSEEVQTAERDFATHNLVFSGSNGTGGIIKISSDRAYTWTTITASTLDVYTGSDLSTQDTVNNPFIDDSYIRYTWTLPFCHNGFKIVGGYTQKNQSYDIGAQILQSYRPEAVIYTNDALVEGISYTSMRMGAKVVQDKNTPYTSDVHIGKHTVTTYDTDMFAEARLKITYRESGYIMGSQGRTYTAGGLIVKSEFPILLLPQAFAIRFPVQSESSFPYDSRWED